MELRVSIRDGVAFQMDHHPLEVAPFPGSNPLVLLVDDHRTGMVSQANRWRCALAQRAEPLSHHASVLQECRRSIAQAVFRLTQALLHTQAAPGVLRCSHGSLHLPVINRSYHCLQAWLASHSPVLRSAALEQRLWARTLPAVGGVNSLDQARAALYRDLARGYRDRCMQVS